MGRLVYTDNFYALKRSDISYRGTNPYYGYLVPALGTSFHDVSGTSRSTATYNASYNQRETAIQYAVVRTAFITDIRRVEFNTSADMNQYVKVGVKPASWSGVYDVPNQLTGLGISISGNQSVTSATTYAPIVISITNNNASPVTFNCIGSAPYIYSFNDTGTSSTPHHFLVWVYETDNDVTLASGDVYTISITKPTTEFIGG